MVTQELLNKAAALLDLCRSRGVKLATAVAGPVGLIAAALPLPSMWSSAGL